jgi:tetratricopeptide repeat protein 25
MKAESYYQMMQFEYALMFYHRGNKQRPEVQAFRLGIQKSQEAIENCIGGQVTPCSLYQYCEAEQC